MKCTCGHEVPEDYKFCGRCGREALRLLHCEKCGYANPQGNRFCGKCGLRLLAGLTATPTAMPTPAFDPSMTEKADPNATEKIAMTKAEERHPLPPVVSEPVVLKKEIPQRREEVVARESSEPVKPIRGSSVSGYSSAPSMLGLGGDSSDSDLSDDGSHYLLDEHPQRGVSGRAWLLLLLLIGGSVLGYLEWKSVNAQNLNSHSLASLLGPNEGNGQTATAPPLPSPSPTTYDASSPSEEGKTGSGGSLNKPESDEGGENLPAKGQHKDPAANLQEEDIQPDGSTQPVKSSPTTPAAVATPAPAHTQQQSVSDPLLDEAAAYLRVHNCSQGLIYLRTAADKPDAEAQVRMGALYMTGNCVAKDRVAAYQWFSRALALEPNNRWVTQSRNIVFEQMTASERRQVQ